MPGDERKELWQNNRVSTPDPISPNPWFHAARAKKQITLPSGSIEPIYSVSPKLHWVPCLPSGDEHRSIWDSCKAYLENSCAGSIHNNTEIYTYHEPRHALRVLGPINDKLSTLAHTHGFTATPIGVEYYWSLQSRSEADLLSLGLAPRIRRQEFRTFDVQDLSEDEKLHAWETLAAMYAQWQHSKRWFWGSTKFSDIRSCVESGEGRLWICRSKQGTIEGLLYARRSHPSHGPIQYMFQEYMKAPSAKWGVVDLLWSNALCDLRRSGADQVTSGLSFMDQVDSKKVWGRDAYWIQFIVQQAPFSGVSEFKRKLRPDRSEKRYLLSNRTIRGWDWVRLGESYYQQKLGKILRDELAKRMSHPLRTILDAGLQPNIPRPPSPQSFLGFIQQTRITWATAGLLIVFQFLVLQNPHWIDSWAYRPASVHWQGLLLSPLIHTGWGHFLGDFFTLVLAGLLVERILGSICFAACALLGAGFSNPIVHLGVFLMGQSHQFPSLLQFYEESDVGSSNGGFAVLGAFAMMTKNRTQTFLGFAFSALLISLTKETWISLHHFVGLCLGAGVALATMRFKKI